MGATEPLTAMTGKVGGLRLIFGAEVSCTDGHCGRVRLLVVDPRARAVTDLAVEPGHWREGRLVPVELVDTASTEVWLRCSRAEFEALQKAEETDYGPASQTPGMHITAWEYPVDAGDVRMRGGEPVYAADGEIGRVRGFVAEPHSQAITHVLLDEGHLWGKKEVAIPMSAITALGGGIGLLLTVEQVRELPSIADQ
jgi:sporulation protein YlmC with PRC-barrel domain